VRQYQSVGNRLTRLDLQDPGGGGGGGGGGGATAGTMRRGQGSGQTGRVLCARNGAMERARNRA